MTWRRTTLITHMRAEQFFSVNRYVDPRQEAPPWYVNFEVPFRRTPIGVETFDVLLDLVIDADLSHYRWKDEDEYVHTRRLGVITEDVHHHVEQAREQVMALARTGEVPFAQDWSAWRSPDDSSPPDLPPTVTTVDTHPV